MKAKTWKVTAATSIAIVATLIFFVTSTTSMTQASEKRNIEFTIPMDYNGLLGVLTAFPKFKATNLHYSNPYLGSPGGPYATLTVDFGFVNESATIHEDTAELNLVARNLKLQVLLAGASVVYISAGNVNLHMDIHPPEHIIPGSVVGTMTATLRGNVKYHVGPLLPLKGDYEGPELTLVITFVQP